METRFEQTINAALNAVCTLVLAIGVAVCAAMIVTVFMLI